MAPSPAALRAARDRLADVPAGRGAHARGDGMNIAVLDDYQDTIRTLRGFQKVAGHDVTIWRDHIEDIDELAKRLKDAEAVTLLRERTPIRAPLIDRLDKLRIISQAGVYPHIDVDACTRCGPASGRRIRSVSGCGARRSGSGDTARSAPSSAATARPSA